MTKSDLINELSILLKKYLESNCKEEKQPIENSIDIEKESFTKELSCISDGIRTTVKMKLNLQKSPNDNLPF